MKHILLILSILIATISLKAQDIVVPALQLTQKCNIGPKIFIKKIGADPLFDIEKFIAKSIKQSPIKRNKKSQALVNRQIKMPNHWINQSFFQIVDSENEADVILTAKTVDFNNKKEVTEKWFREDKMENRHSLPFKEIVNKQTITGDYIITLSYKSNETISDTIHLNVSKRQNIQKKPINSRSIKSRAQSQISQELNKLLTWKFLVSKPTRIIFPKVKIKDKVLKAEYKTLSKKIKEGKIEEVANFYRKVLDLKPTPEAHYCLGICYEVVGDYDNAMKEYKHKFDFHTKIRMKKQLEVYNHLKELGCDLTPAMKL